jgi:hypothetical protein
MKALIFSLAPRFIGLLPPLVIALVTLLVILIFTRKNSRVSHVVIKHIFQKLNR